MFPLISVGLGPKEEKVAKKLGRFLFFVPLLMAPCVSLAVGVDISGKIRGSVVDPSGAAMPEAVLTAHNQQTGVGKKGYRGTRRDVFI